MTRDKFRTVVKALITHKGKILIGQKEECDKVISGKWHFLGGHLEKGEQMEEAIVREVKEDTDLDVKVHQIIDVMSFSWGSEGEKDSVQVLYHCEADSKEEEPKDDLQEVKWVEPENLKKKLWEEEADRVRNRDNQRKFVEKLKKMPRV